MKKIILTTICAVLVLGLMGQAPQGISHQAVIRNAANELVANATIGVRVSILQGSAEGTEVYSEINSPQSNANGLITFVIGQGIEQSSNFSAIDWAGGPYFVKTEADPEGGVNYTIEGVSQLWSVPYALSAGATGAGYSSGDSLVLKDQEGMTRFVLNPNTGMFKMMHNDTVWYSIGVSSPPIYTFTDAEGRVHDLHDSHGNYTVYSDESRTQVVEESKKYFDVLGKDSELFKYYDNGNLKYSYTKDQTQFNPAPVFREEIVDYNENGEIRKKVIRKSDGVGKILNEEVYSGERKKSETTHESNYFPSLGFEIDTDTTDTYQGEEVLVKKEIKLSSLKNTAEEKYEEKVTTNQFYENGVLSREVIESLVDQWNETVKTQERTARMFDQLGNQVSEIKVKNTSDADYNHQSGAISRSNTTEMYANGVKLADQNRSMNHYPDPSNYTEDSESSATYLPDGSLISKTLSEKATWPGGTQEIFFNSYYDNNDLLIEFHKQLQNGLPQNSSMTKDGINREYTAFTHNDNLKKSVTSYKNSSNVTTALVTEELNKNDAQHKRTIEKPGEGFSTIIQNNNQIELLADQVVSNGDHLVTGNLNVTGTKNFCIDHPADPGNKYLVHAAIESSEALNQYSGNVITNADGFARVNLPDYFYLINIDFRYQLTIVSATFARAIVFGEIDENNQFIIKTDQPNIKVSWQVTAKRNDQYLIGNPFSDVLDK